MSLASAAKFVRAVFSAGPYSAVLAAYACRKRGAWQKLVEFAHLIALVKRHRPRIVLEIGTSSGGTLWTWCKLAADGAWIVSVDLPGGPYGGGYPEHESETFRGYAERGQRIELLRADSHEPSTLEAVSRILDGNAIDLLFIDGDHTYAGVKRDFEMYGPLARGLVVFHDILRHDAPEIDVERFWNEVKDDYRSEEFVNPEHGRWGGIGVLYLDGGPTGSHQS